MRRGGQRVQLSPTEFKLLRYLMLNANRVLSKAQILDHVWNYDFRGDDNIVESYISYLRRKVDTVEPRLIHTLRGVGYVLRKPAVVKRRLAMGHRCAASPLRVKLVAAVLALVAVALVVISVASALAHAQLPDRPVDDAAGRSAARPCAEPDAAGTAARQRVRPAQRLRRSSPRTSGAGGTAPVDLGTPSTTCRRCRHRPDLDVDADDLGEPYTVTARRRRRCAGGCYVTGCRAASVMPSAQNLYDVDQAVEPAGRGSTCSSAAAVLILLAVARRRAGPAQPAPAGRDRADRGGHRRPAT